MKTQTVSHTPTPWSVQAINGTMDREIKLFKQPNYLYSPMPGVRVKGHNAEANAEFIVRACNAHDELVAALEVAFTMAKRTYHAGHNVPELEQIQRAIAKAKQNQSDDQSDSDREEWIRTHNINTGERL
jgi:hypothetical protein